MEYVFLTHPSYAYSLKRINVMKKINLLLIIFSLFLLAQRTEARKIITGTVYDETNTPLIGTSVFEKGTTNGTISNHLGNYIIEVSDENSTLVFSFIGYKTIEISVKGKDKVDVIMNLDVVLLNEEVEHEEELDIDEVVVVGYGIQNKREITSAIKSYTHGLNGNSSNQNGVRDKEAYSKAYCLPAQTPLENEDYAGFSENKFLDPKDAPLSTFSVDVDRASYTNVRRYINNGSLPPTDAVRIEEMINYFNYNYAEPSGAHPFAIHHELAICPWNEQHYLMKVALQGKKIKKDNLPPSNLVFLLDVSGSMNANNKLPLLKSSLKLLVSELRDEDKVSIVVYAGAAGVVLEPTSGNKKREIVEALDRLSAGGSTAGGAGLKLAYKLAHDNFIEEGNNRIILATDGDFNVGISSNDDMEKLIEAERDNGIYMTVAGFGMGNYKDSKMEIIADKGNGNYFYIDNIQEARKAMVEEFGGTLYTIAKDVKFQLEFNPSLVAGYRLIGYENRMLNKEDFNDDKKDAGEIGAGHTVTALYEIISVGSKDVSEYLPGVDPLKYQSNLNRNEKRKSDDFSNELLTLKLRYKKPHDEKSTLLVETVQNQVSSLNNTSDDFRFASSVAAWGMILRKSPYAERVNYADVIGWAKNSRSKDEQGYRSEMIRLMESAAILSNGLAYNLK